MKLKNKSFTCKEKVACPHLHLSTYLKRFFLIFIILSVMAFFLNKIQFMLFTIPYVSVFGFDYLFQVYFNEYRHPYFANIIITVLVPNLLLFILVYKISVFLNKKYIFYVIIFFIWFLNSYFNLYVFIDSKFQSLYTSSYCIFNSYFAFYLYSLMAKDNYKIFLQL